MGNPKQNIIPPGEIPPLSLHEAALNAHNLAHKGGAPSADEVTSLNKLLQWGAAHSAPSTTGDTQRTSAVSQQSAEDREWLSAAFPDMNAEVKRLLGLLNTALPASGTPPSATSTEDIAELLEALEEYLSDINYAHNLASLRVLPPLLRALAHAAAPVRAAAAWCAGSALQDAPQNASLLADTEKGVQLVVGTLRDPVAAVRAKGVRAVSALLRAATENLRKEMRDMGVGALLRDALCDADGLVRSRALFFLAHAAECGNEWFGREVVEDDRAIARVVGCVEQVDVEDVAAVEGAVGAVKALVCLDSAKVVHAVPGISAVLRGVRVKCSEEECCALLDEVLRVLG